MSDLIDREALLKRLHDAGGCGAPPEAAERRRKAGPMGMTRRLIWPMGWQRTPQPSTRCTRQACATAGSAETITNLD